MQSIVIDYEIGEVAVDKIGDLRRLACGGSSFGGEDEAFSALRHTVTVRPGNRSSEAR